MALSEAVQQDERVAPLVKVGNRSALRVLREVTSLYRSLRKSRVQLWDKYVIIYRENVAGGLELGINDGLVRAYKEPVGYITKLVNTPNTAIVCFDEVPPAGWVEGYLFAEREGLLACLGKGEGITPEMLKNVLRLLLGKEAAKELLEHEAVKGALSEGDATTAAANLPVDVFRYRRHDPYLGRRVLERWGEFRDELFAAYDPWLREIYEAYLLPFPHARYAPHLILATNSGVGKSTLANAIGIEVDRTTLVGLVGGLIDKKVRVGLLHGKNHLVQVAQFESTDRETLPHLENLLANGVARRWVYAQNLETRFSGALVFTTNIESTLDSMTPILSIISKLSNPIAVGTRFLLMAHPSLVYANRELEFDVEAVHEALMSVRALVKRKVKEIYSQKAVREWLDEPPEAWEDVESILRGTEWGNDTLRAYMHTVASEGFRKLKALALGRAISVNLDRIHFEDVDPAKLLEIADEFIGDKESGYIKMLVDSATVINNTYEEDLDRLAINLRQNRKMLFLKHLLDALNELVRRSLEALTSREAEIKLDELMELIMSMAGKKWRLSRKQFTEKLRTVKNKSYGGLTLGDIIGLDIDEEKGTVKVVTQNLLHLHKELEKRAAKYGLM